MNCTSIRLFYTINILTCVTGEGLAKCKYLYLHLDYPFHLHDFGKVSFEVLFFTIVGLQNFWKKKYFHCISIAYL